MNIVCDSCGGREEYLRIACERVHWAGGIVAMLCDACQNRIGASIRRHEAFVTLAHLEDDRELLLRYAEHRDLSQDETDSIQTVHAAMREVELRLGAFILTLLPHQKCLVDIKAEPSDK